MVLMQVFLDVTEDISFLDSILLVVEAFYAYDGFLGIEVSQCEQVLSRLVSLRRSEF